MGNVARAEDLRRAVDLALAGDWDGAHAIAQREGSDPLFCWLHACLHKIEGDVDNSRYWYAKAARHFETYGDTTEELRAIRAAAGS